MVSFRGAVTDIRYSSQMGVGSAIAVCSRASASDFRSLRGVCIVLEANGEAHLSLFSSGCDTGPLRPRVHHHPNGQKEKERKYKSGNLEGRWSLWNKDGSINTERSGIYKADKKIAPLPKMVEAGGFEPPALE